MCSVYSLGIYGSKNVVSYSHMAKTIMLGQKAGEGGGGGGGWNQKCKPSGNIEVDIPRYS